MTIFAGKIVAEMQEINAKTVDKNLILLLINKNLLLYFEYS
jgi:hypothetical protein